ncbi:MAG: D-glycerate dehydrogenase [Planctomycetes bacterium]|nr:D-glycerate dehydrogenase [Planctomycetota bacterium]
MKFKVFVTREIPKMGIALLRKNGCSVDIFNADRRPLKEELLRHIRGKHAILCLLTDKIDRDVITAGLPALKVISNLAAGTDNIDLEFAAQNGITVTNTPDALTDATAELAGALIFACARRIIESDDFTRRGLFKGWEPMLFRGADIHHQTLGIIGAGKIGQSVAEKSAGFNMKILYTAHARKKDFEARTGARKTTLQKLLKESDFVSIHAPLTQETRHMLTRKELSIMKPAAYLINTGRGPIIKEDDLVWALKNRKIAGAGLDVYEFEPAIHKDLIDLPNVVLLPHIGSATVKTRETMSLTAADNIIAVLHGYMPKYIVNA